MNVRKLVRVAQVITLICGCFLLGWWSNELIHCVLGK